MNALKIKLKFKSKKILSVIMPIAIIVLAGCPTVNVPPKDGGISGKTSGGLNTPANPPAETNSDSYVLRVRMKIIAVEVPMGKSSGSENLWSYLNEEAVSHRFTGMLGRNGFRVGTGNKQTLTDVLAILRKMTGRELSSTEASAWPGEPISITVKGNQPAHTIFLFHDDQTVSGSDYPAGENILTFAASLDADDRSKMTVTVLPRIRSRRRRATVINNIAGPRLTSKPVEYPFRELAFQMDIPSGNFFLIGPGTNAIRKNSVARSFLLNEKDGIESENLFIIVPEVVAIPIKKSSAGRT